MLYYARSNGNSGNMKIRRIMLRGKRCWCVDARDKKAGRRFFSDKAAAQAWADSLGLESALGQEAWLKLSQVEKANVIGVWSQMQTAGVSINEVWRHWQETLGGAGALTLSEAVDKYLKECLSGNVAYGSYKAYRGELRRFCSLHGDKPVSTVTADHVREYLDGLKVPVTRRNKLVILRSFWRWAVSADLCKDVTRSLKRPKIDRRAPSVFAPETTLTLLEKCAEVAPELAGWLVLGLFVGCRPYEALEVSWEYVRKPEIRILFGKLRRQRLVEPMPSAWLWLDWAKSIGGQLPITRAVMCKRCWRLAEAMGWDAWPRDKLRHTAATHWLAFNQDAKSTAFQLGNSETVLYQHYRQVVTQEQARKYWALKPQMLTLKKNMEAMPEERRQELLQRLQELQSRLEQ